MASNKILFLVLVGCAVALAVPVKREVESNEVAEHKPEAQEPEVDVEVHEITEEEFNEIYKKIKETIDKVFNEANSQKNVEEAFDELKNIFDKIFNEHKENVESVESDVTTETNVETTEIVESKENTVSDESAEINESSQSNADAA